MHLIKHKLCMLYIFRFCFMSSLHFSFSKLSKLLINSFTILGFLVSLKQFSFVLFFNLFILKEFCLLLEVFSCLFSSFLFVIKSLIFGKSFSVNILQFFVNCTCGVAEEALHVCKTFISNFSIS